MNLKELNLLKSLIYLKTQFVSLIATFIIIAISYTFNFKKNS